MRLAVAMHSGVLNEARLADTNTSHVINTLLKSYSNPFYDSVYLIEIQNGEAEVFFKGPHEDDYLTEPYEQIKLIPEEQT